MRKSLRGRQEAIPTKWQPTVRKPIVGKRIVRIFVDGLLEEPNRLLKVLFVAFVPEEPAFGIRKVRGGVGSAHLGESRAVGRCQCDANFVGDSLGDIGLQDEHVAQTSFVAVAPQVSVHAGLNEFHIDPYPSPERNTEPSTTASTF